MFNLKSLKFLVIGSLLTLSSISMAATDTVDLSGTVASTLTVDATATAGAANLLLTEGTNRIVKVGVIVASTNNEQGLTIATSDGNLTKTNGTSIAYVTTATTNPAVPTSGEFGAANTNTSAAGSLTQDLYMMFSPAQYQDPGQYVGQITVTVSDN